MKKLKNNNKKEKKKGNQGLKMSPGTLRPCPVAPRLGSRLA
jgi:hypothetical protein